MIKKPENYEQLKNNYETLNAGGHKCVIKEAREDKDSNGKDILVITFDTDKDDQQPAFFTNAYLKDTRENKKWPYSGQRTFWIESQWFENNLAKLTGAIEKSNPSINIWDTRTDSLNLDWLKGLKIGIVFGQEEYIKDDRSVGVTVKPRFFCGYDEAEAQPIPKKKEAKPRADIPSVANFDFVNVADELGDEGLPFK